MNLEQPDHVMSAELAVLRRVAEAAKLWRDTRPGGAWTLQGSSKELTNIMFTIQAREQALINAVDAMKSGTQTDALGTAMHIIEFLYPITQRADLKATEMKRMDEVEDEIEILKRLTYTR